MIGWCIFLLCFILLLCMPCGIYAHYNSEKTIAKLIIGPIRVNLLHSRKKHSKTDKSKSPDSSAETKEKRRFRDYLPIVKPIFALLRDFRRRVIIKNLQFRLVLGGSDPYDLSINYGRCWAVLGNLFPYLESLFTIRNRNLEIECDYTADTTKIDAAIDLRISLFTLLRMTFYHGIQIFKSYKTAKDEKDGATA